MADHLFLFEKKFKFIKRVEMHNKYTRELLKNESSNSSDFLLE